VKIGELHSQPELVSKLDVNKSSTQKAKDMGKIIKYIIFIFIGIIVQKSFIYSQTKFDSTDFDWEKMYPLNNGDIWVYKYTYTKFFTDYKIKKVEKDTIINNKIYKQISTYYKYDDHTSYSYERIDSSSFIYKWVFDHEERFLKLNVSKNDTFYSDILWPKSEDDMCYWLIEDEWYYDNKRNVLYYWDYLVATSYQLVENVGIVQKLYEAGNFEQLKGSYVNGILLGDTITTSNSIYDIKEKNISNFVLTAYPNPFNSRIVIKYMIPKTTSISIKITNLLGQEIYSRNNNTKISPGSYSFSWTGVNNRGNKVTSGIYFIVISDGASRASKKIMFLQ